MAGEVFSSATSPQTAVDRRPQNLNAPNPVTQYYGVKQGLYTAKSWDQLHAICEQHGLDASHLPKDRLPGEFERKGLVAQYFESHFEQAQTPQEHFKRLVKVTNNVREHLTAEQADAALVVSGSYARGKNGTRSDLDFTLILEKARSEQDVQREVDKIKRLHDAGIIFSEDEHAFDDVAAVVRQGRGLTRLYGMTQEGVLTEFFVIGAEDAMDIPHPFPGHVRRIRPVEPKLEERTSLHGRTRALYKGPDVVKHYLRDEEGEPYIGFFPSLLLEGQVLYDKQGRGKEVQQRVWEGVVRAFLYHNDAYVVQDNRRHAHADRASFERFLEVMRYPKLEHYSEEKAEQLALHYYQAVNRVLTRLNRNS